MVNDFVGHWLEPDGLMQVVRDAEIMPLSISNFAKQWQGN